MRKSLDFIQFLKDELALPPSSIDLAMRRSDSVIVQVPMILWQYGLITLGQLNQIFDWMERA